MPVIEENLGPKITEALARSSDLLRDDADALDDFANQFKRQTKYLTKTSKEILGDKKKKKKGIKL